MTKVFNAAASLVMLKEELSLVSRWMQELTVNTKDTSMVCFFLARKTATTLLNQSDTLLNNKNTNF